MNEIVVSIIIATFNSEKTLKVALDSVLNQSFKDWECIVIDGASNDNTVNIIKEYIERDNRFSYVSEPDNGVYDAFNKGWKMAKGEWVYYLGSDDRLTKEGLACLLHEEHNEAAVVNGFVYIVKSNGIVSLQKSMGWGGCHQGRITRKSVIEEMGGFNCFYRILADKDLYSSMRNNGFKIDNVEFPVAYFSMGGMSQNFCNLWKCYKENVMIYSNNSNEKYPRLCAFGIFMRAFISNLYNKVKGRIC